MLIGKIRNLRNLQPTRSSAADSVREAGNSAGLIQTDLRRDPRTIQEMCDEIAETIYTSGPSSTNPGVLASLNI